MLTSALWLACPRLRAASTQDWPAVGKDELGENAPAAADIPAEILLLKLNLDDADYPEYRTTHEYLRAKIYKPEQMEWLGRISGREVSYSRANYSLTVTLRARLTLPNGTTKVFGEEAIRERTISKSREGTFMDRLLGTSEPEVKERFLAVGGVEAGSILEIQIDRREKGSGATPTSSVVLQRRQLPIRKLEVAVRAPSARDWIYQYFLLNRSLGGSVMKEDTKHHTFTVSATHLPPIVEEPMSGLNSTYYALSLVGCFEKRDRTTVARHHDRSYRVDPAKTGPWSVVSVPLFMMLDDYVEITSRIRKLTTGLTSSTTDPLEKAKRIHTEVSGLYANFAREVRFNKTEPSLSSLSTTLDHTLNYTRKSPFFNIDKWDYLALAVSMYKAAGLETRVVLLPDRRVIPFGRQLVSRTFLPNPAVSVKINDKWLLSTPTLLPSLPLGEIPWYCEGQVGLVVKEGPEEFIDVPYSDGKKSFIGNAGTFVLNADGSLEGTAKRKYTGHSAFIIRQNLLNRDLSKQRAYLARLISREFKLPLKHSPDLPDEPGEDEPAQEMGAVKISHFIGLDSMDTPLEIDYRIRIPDYAVVSDNRIIFRPWVFRANETNPFVSESRSSEVHFPYALQELDLETIKLPAGCMPQLTEVVSPSSGPALHFKSTAAFDAKTGQLKLRREYASNLVKVPVKFYPELKNWYDALSRVDQQEAVATLAAVPGAAPAPKSPANPPAPSPGETAASPAHPIL